MHSWSKLLGSVLPGSIEKNNVYYYLKKSPEKYMECTRRLCCLLGEQCKFISYKVLGGAMPCEIDTESTRGRWSGERGLVGIERHWMTQFGRVWSSPKWWQVRAGISNFIMKYQQIDWQFQCYFIFYKVPSKRADPPISVIPPDCTDNLLPSKVIGLDPGKRTMVDADGNVMKYSARQRNFESKLTRFRTVLESEKKKTGIEQLEFSLSQFWATWPLSTRNTLSCKPLWKIS